MSYPADSNNLLFLATQPQPARNYINNNNQSRVFLLMTGLNNLIKSSQILIVCFMLTSCSLVGWYQSDSGNQKREVHSQAESGWSYREILTVDIDESLPFIATVGGQARLIAACELEPEAVNWLKTGKRGLVLPALSFASDATFAPDLSKSISLYKTFDQHLRLNSASDSFGFYNTLLSSIEHTCPDNMIRDMDTCQFRKWMSFTGFSSSDRIYDTGRIERWLRKHPDVDYFIMGSAELFNSEAMLSSRYSSHSRVLTRMETAERIKLVDPFAGQVRYDWAKLDSGSVFKSYGYCDIRWPEFESLAAVRNTERLTIEQRQAVVEFIFPHFIEFLDKAASELTDK